MSTPASHPPPRRHNAADWRPSPRSLLWVALAFAAGVVLFAWAISGGRQDDFLRAVENDGDWNLTARKDGRFDVTMTVDAKKLYAKGTIDHDALKAAGLARAAKHGVRLLGKGALTAKVSFKVAGASKGAIEAVEKAGGKVELPEPKPEGEGKKAKRKAEAANQG